MSYTLYNKKLDRKLEHPIIGLWHTSDIQEARNMLLACKEWLCASGMSDLESDFTIVIAETGEEV
jgi:hypothetical protein